VQKECRIGKMRTLSSTEQRTESKKNVQSWILATPALGWLLFFFLVPYFIVVLYSFLTPTIYDIKPILTLESYREVLDLNYLKSFWLSFRLAFETTIICILLGYPVAYFIARSSDRVKNILLILIIIPFWTNFIIRIFAWRIFLSPNGVMNQVLLALHIVQEPLRMLRTDFAVIMVMVYVYLPYMILPLYGVLEKLDFTLLNAAMDLGANEKQAFRKITLPLSQEGLFAGSILVFIPSLGAYIIPQLVGNQNFLYIGQVITYKIKNIPRNWPMASALSLILLLLVAVMLLLIYHIYSIRRQTKNGY